MGDQELPPHEVLIPNDDSPVTSEKIGGTEFVDYDTDNPNDYQDPLGNEDSQDSSQADSDGGDS